MGSGAVIDPPLKRGLQQLRQLRRRIARAIGPARTSDFTHFFKILHVHRHKARLAVMRDRHGFP
jgi:hypothetical protein